METQMGGKSEAEPGLTLEVLAEGPRGAHPSQEGFEAHHLSSWLVTPMAGLTPASCPSLASDPWPFAIPILSLPPPAPQAPSSEKSPKAAPHAPVPRTSGGGDISFGLQRASEWTDTPAREKAKK